MYQLCKGFGSSGAKDVTKTYLIALPFYFIFWCAVSFFSNLFSGQEYLLPRHDTGMIWVLVGMCFFVLCSYLKEIYKLGKSDN